MAFLLLFDDNDILKATKGNCDLDNSRARNAVLGKIRSDEGNSHIVSARPEEKDSLILSKDRSRIMKGISYMLRLRSVVWVK